VVAGRNLELSHPSDRRAVLLNESAVRSLGFPSPEGAVGQMVSASTWHLDSFLVVGVVADYHQEGLQKVIHPLVLWRCHRHSLLWPARTFGIQRLAAQQGDQYPQGSGRIRACFVVLAFCRLSLAGGSSVGDCSPCQLDLNGQLAAKFRHSYRDQLVDIRPFGLSRFNGCIFNCGRAGLEGGNDQSC